MKFIFFFCFLIEKLFYLFCEIRIFIKVDFINEVFNEKGKKKRVIIKIVFFILVFGKFSIVLEDCSVENNSVIIVW